MKVIGSRKRGLRQSSGERMVLVVRRLRCKVCGRVHHELPDILVPFKRYGAESIEAVITTSASALNVAADEATINRWKRWFSNWADYLAGCLLSIAIRYIGASAEDSSQGATSSLQRIWHHVGSAPCWLARVVRSVANANLWPQTRSA